MSSMLSWIARVETPKGMAARLLDEIASGMVPVWPSTVRQAERLVKGLEALRETRGVEVMRAVLRAPTGNALPWHEMLRPLTL